MKKITLLTAFIALLFASCTKDNARISMTFNKATAVYADIDEIRATELYSTPTTIDNPGKIFIGSDFILIGEKGSGIHVFDNSNPASPINVSFIQLPFTKEFFVEGTTIYAESQYDFLKIDISSINNPTLVDRVEYAFAEPVANDKGDVLVGFTYEVVTESFKTNSPEAQALEESYYLYYNYNNSIIPASSVPSSFVGASKEIKGTLNKIATANNHVYVISDQKLHNFQNSSTTMSLVSSEYVSSGMETVYAEDNHLFIGTQSSMIIMNVSNPSAPSHISDYYHPTSCDPVLPYGNIAYVTLRTADFTGCSGDENSLDVLDITDINNPTEINTIALTSPYGLNVINNYLYIGEGVNGLTIFDATDPANPVFLGTNTAVEVYDVIEHPFIPNQIITTSENGLEQYEINLNTLDIVLLSNITY